MLISELIERLSAFPPDLEVRTEPGQVVYDIAGPDKYHTDKAVWLFAHNKED